MRNKITTLFSCFMLFVGLVSGQITVTKTNTTDASNHGTFVDLTVSFVSGVDFPVGYVITDVNAQVIFDAIGGTNCTTGHAGGPPFNQDVYYRLTSPAATNVALIESGGPATAGSGQPKTYSDNTTYGGLVTVNLDQAAGSLIPGATLYPTSGTFRPVQSLNVYNGQSPFGTWTMRAGDAASFNDAVCHKEFSVTITAAPACAAPVITSNPVAASVCPNGAASFSAAATGQDSVRWQVSTNGGGTWTNITNGAPYSGATTTTLSINPATSGMNGYQYRMQAFACNPVQTATSGSGILTVTDVVAPSITCPGAQTFFLGASCQAALPNFTSLASASDNCDPSPAVTQSPVPGTIISGHNSFLSVSLFATDASLNSSTCTFTATAVDSTSPNAICRNFTAHLSGGTVSITANDVNNGSNDNCSVGGLSVSPAVFNCNDIGPQTVTLTVNDGAGNSSTCNATVTVADTSNSCCVPPVISSNPVNASVCPNVSASFSVSISGQDSLRWQVSTNGGGTWLNIVNGAPYSGATSASLVINPASVGLNGYQYRAIGFACNPVTTDTSTAATLTVSDNTAPAITCPGNQTVILSGSCQAGLPPFTGAVSVTDNCDPSPALSQNPIAGTTVSGPGNTTSVTITATDASGNVDSCSFVVTNQDTTPPTAICQPVSVTLDGTGNAVVTASAADGGSSDNCGITLTTLGGGINLSVTCGDIGTNPFTLQVQDVAGLTSSCIANITVVDTTSPTAICQNTTVVLDGSGNATITGPGIGGGSIDNCGIASLSVSPATFTCSNIGPNAVTLTATDASANSSTCFATVTVQDTTPPLAICQNISVHLDGTGNVSVPAIAVDAGSSDACGIANRTLSGNTSLNYNCNDLGANPEILTVTDGSGLQASCSATITVLDTIPPVALCQPVTVTLDGSGNATISASSADAGSSDNCSIAQLTLGGSTTVSFTCPDVGTTGLSLTVTDPAGNTNSCIANITIQDTTPPVALCQNISVVLDGTGNATITGGSVGGSSSDNCGIASLSVSPATFNCGNIGPNAVILTATDASANSSTCSATVTVQDTVPPVMVCMNDTVYLDTAFTAMISPIGVDGGSSDNCSLDSVWVNPMTVNAPGTVTVQLIGRDAQGSLDSCAATVLVLDTLPPSVSCVSGYSSYIDQVQLSTNTTISGNNAVAQSFRAGISGDLTRVDLRLRQAAGAGVNVNLVSGTNPTGPVVASANIPAVGTSLTNYSVTFPTPATVTSGTQYTLVIDDNNAVGAIGAAVSSTNIYPGGNFWFNPSTWFPQPSVDMYFRTYVAFIGPSDTVFIDSTGAGVLSAGDLNGGSSDNSGSVVFTVSDSVFGCSDVDSIYAITLYGTDPSGNVDSCIAQVAIIDNISPVAVCLDTTLYLDTAGNASLLPADIDGGSWDNCGLVSIALSDSSWSCPDTGLNVVTLTVAASNGATATCTSNITVRDTTTPLIICPANISVSNDSLDCSAVVNYTITSGDNCAGASLVQTQGLPDGASFPIGTTLNTYEITDGSGNSDSCSFTVTVQDNESPSVTCPPNAVLPTDPGQCTAFRGFFVFTTDNCPGPFLTQTSGLPSGSNYPLGITTNSFVVSDSAGNQDSCSFTIQVSDQEDPVVTCPGNITVNNDPGQCDAVVTFAVSGSDNCTGDTVIQVSGLPSGGNFPVGSTLNTFVALDASGNTDTCSFTVQVTDNENPVVTCPAPVSVVNDSGQCNAVVNYLVSVADNCPGDTTVLLSGLASGATFPVGTTNISFAGIDAAGNSDTCSFTVTVTDAEAPVAICPSPISVSNDPNLCSAVVTYSVSQTDNCPGSSLAQISGNPSGGTFPVGTTNNVFVATDAVGNLDSCSFTVTVVDNQLPTITCPANISRNNDPGQCSAIVSYVVTSGDNCPGQTVSQSAGLASGSAFPVAGPTTNTFVVTDASGNSDSCSFTVTVTDIEDPVIFCPSNRTVNNDPGQCDAVVTYPAPTSTDNCPGQVITQSGGLSSGSTFPVGQTLESFVVTDGAGNTDSCSFFVFVLDNEDPVISCPPSDTVFTDPGQCSNSYTFSLPGATDNCPGVTVSQTGGFVSGFPFPVGVTTNSFIAVDTSSNVDTCSFRLTVVDGEAPVVTCPADRVVPNDSGQCGAVVSWATPGTSDNCSVDTLVQISGLSSGTPFPTGISIQQFVVTDTAGNADSCSFSVQVLDNEAPEVICPLNQTVFADSSCSSVLQDYTTQATISDNCVSISSISQSPVAGTSLNGGGSIYSVTISAVDTAGNTGNCAFTVTLADSTRPVVICPANDTVAVDGSCDYVLANYTSQVQASDNCANTVNLLQAPLPGGLYNGAGTIIPVTIAGTDSFLNVDSCSFTITLADSSAPAVTCPPDTVLFADATCAANLPNYTTVGTVADNCDPTPGFVQTPTVGFSLTGHLDSVRVVLTGTDASSNADSCSFVVTLLDTTSPVLACPPNQFYFNDTAQCGAVGNYPAVSASDNCNTPVPVLDAGNGTGGFFPVGVTTEMYSVADSAGNVDSCSFTVTVIDAEQPFFTGCPADTVITLDSTACDISFVFTPPVAVDNCVPDTVFSSHVSGAVFSAGRDTIVYTVVDIGGNTATCSFMVEVLQDPLDNQFVLSQYPGGYNVSCAGSEDGTVDAGAMGGCIPYQYMWSTGDTTPGISMIGGGNYSVTITDGSGRVITRSVTVTEPPAFSDSLITLVGGEPQNCIGDTVTLQGNAGFVSYSWSTGDSTQSIVTDSSGSFILTVTDSLGCMGMDTMGVVFQPWIDPNPMITPAGPITLCDGDTITLDVGAGYFLYDWNTGDSTRRIRVTQTGSYSVRVQNGFGCERTSAAVSVTVVPNPAVPVVTLVGDTLFSTPAYSYQWYLDSVLVGADMQYHIPTASGPYYVVVSDSNGCSATSNTVDFTIGIGEAEMGESLSIYPNPFEHTVNLEIDLPKAAKIQVQIVDITGKILWSRQSDYALNFYKEEIDLSSVSNGIYYMRINAGGSIWVRKIVKQ